MSKSTNSVSTQKSQDILSNNRTVDHKKASELEASICRHLEMAIRYADFAIQHDEIFDHTGFALSADKFVGHARHIAAKLKELRKARGLLG